MLPGVCLMTRSRREFWWDEAPGFGTSSSDGRLYSQAGGRESFDLDESEEWRDGSGSSSHGSEGTVGQENPEEAGCGVSRVGQGGSAGQSGVGEAWLWP